MSLQITFVLFYVLTYVNFEIWVPRFSEGVLRTLGFRNFEILMRAFHFIPKNSAIGPSVNAGKNDSAATMEITPNTITPNVLVSVFNVPALSGMNFFFARIPAMATG